MDAGCLGDLVQRHPPRQPVGVVCESLSESEANHRDILSDVCSIEATERRASVSAGRNVAYTLRNATKRDDVTLTPSTPSPNVPPFSLSWAAGFADGEACIHIAHQTYPSWTGRTSTYRLRFSISQNDREVLEHFLNGVGISGRIHATRRTVGQNRQGYVLQYDGRHAFELITQLKDLLVRKRHEALVACTFWRHGMCGTRFGPNGVPPEIQTFRRSCYAKLRRLK